MTRSVGYVLIVLVLVARAAQAQAWLPPAGAGSVSVFVQTIDQSGHRLDVDDPARALFGPLLRNGKSTNVTILSAFDYAVTDRFLISMDVPYVFAKYRGPGGPPPGIPFLPVDSCFCWHRGWQDVGIAARFNVIDWRGAVAVTPSVSFGFPTHSYARIGEAVIGRNLREIRAGVDVSQRLDAISPKLAASARYSYTFVERVLEIPNNRSNFSIEISYSLQRNFSVVGLAWWQYTHGGLRFPLEVLPFPERIDEHDRLLRDNSVHVGASMTYSPRNGRFDVFGSYTAFIGGTNTHAGKAITVGVTRWFSVGR